MTQGPRWQSADRQAQRQWPRGGRRSLSSETSEQGVDKRTSNPAEATDTTPEEKSGEESLSEFPGTVKKQEAPVPLQAVGQG